MGEMEDKNRDARVKQQKSTFIRNMIICVSILLIFTLVFWLVSRNAAGTEISFNEFQTQLANGNIEEIQLKQSKIQIYYVNGEAHWLYNRESAENTIVGLVNELFADDTYTGSIPKVIFGTTTTISIMSILYPILSIVVFGFMIFFILRQVKGANNKSFEKVYLLLIED